MICALPAYTISWTDPNKRQYDIAISFTAPAWRPGWYLIQNYAANVTQCGAADLGGDSPRVEKNFFDRYVHGTEPLPYCELFAAVGVEIDLPAHDARPSLPVFAAMAAGSLSSTHFAAEREWLLDCFPAMRSFPSMGRETINESDAATVLRSLDMGTAVEMIVSRAGVIRVMALTAAPDPRVKVTLRATGGNPMRDRWLGRANG